LEGILRNDPNPSFHEDPSFHCPMHEEEEEEQGRTEY
jgi:hypothetical protein